MVMPIMSLNKRVMGPDDNNHSLKLLLTVVFLISYSNTLNYAAILKGINYRYLRIRFYWFYGHYALINTTITEFMYVATSGVLQCIINSSM